MLFCIVLLSCVFHGILGLATQGQIEECNDVVSLMQTALAQEKHHLYKKTPSRKQIASRSFNLPRFESPTELMSPDNKRWRTYLEFVYGDAIYDPSVHPIDVSNFQMLHKEYLRSAGLFNDNLQVKQCPQKELDLYSNWRWASANELRVWHSAPPKALPNDTWVEVTHCGAGEIEAHGTWMYHMKGSGVFYNIGKTLPFQTHLQAVKYFIPDAPIQASLKINDTRKVVKEDGGLVLRTQRTHGSLFTVSKEDTHFKISGLLGPLESKHVRYLVAEVVMKHGKKTYLTTADGALLVLNPTLHVVEATSRTLDSPLQGDELQVDMHDVCMNGDGCSTYFERLVAAAAAKGFTSLQFLGHKDEKCGEIGHEILDLHHAGTHNPCSLSLAAGFGKCSCQCKLVQPVSHASSSVPSDCMACNPDCSNLSPFDKRMSRDMATFGFD
jgi:hypothetical protein